jgi:hypothetical protein
MKDMYRNATARIKTELGYVPTMNSNTPWAAEHSNIARTGRFGAKLPRTTEPTMAPVPESVSTAARAVLVLNAMMRGVKSTRTIPLARLHAPVNAIIAMRGGCVSKNSNGSMMSAVIERSPPTWGIAATAAVEGGDSDDDDRVELVAEPSANAWPGEDASSSAGSWTARSTKDPTTHVTSSIRKSGVRSSLVAARTSPAIDGATSITCVNMDVS